MGNKYDDILKKDAFKSIPKETLEGLKKLMIQIEGRSVNDSILLIMKFYGSLPKGNPLTKEQRTAMIEAIMGELDDVEKEKLKKILLLINN